MASKKSNQILIKPMNNAAAIASTLGISAKSVEPTIEPTLRKNGDEIVDSEASAEIQQSTAAPQTQSSAIENERQIKKRNLTAARKGSESATSSEIAPKANQAAIRVAAVEMPEMPMMIEIKRKFPGKELYILSLLYLQRNNRGLVQMTVGSMMALYSAVFDDVIKDDTARRSLKRLFDAGFIKTTSIPGNNSGYIYQIGDLLEAENFTEAEKEEFAELTEFVKSKLNGAPARTS